MKVEELKENLRDCSTEGEFIDRLTEYFYQHQMESFEEYEKENRTPDYKV